MLAMCRPAVLAPAAPAKKVTVKAVLAPGPTGAVGFAVTVKSPEFGPVMVTPRPVRSALPMLLMVKVRWELRRRRLWSKG